MRPLAEAPYLDLFDPEFQADPTEVIAELRRQSTVIRTPIGALVVDRARVHELLRDRSLHQSLMQLVQLQGVVDGPLFEMAAASLLAKEGEDHTRIRRLVSRSFTPRAADADRPFMRQLVTELVDGFAGAGECEFMTDFGDLYPVQVIAQLMGVPQEDHPLFGKWGDALTHLLSFELSMHRAEVESAQAAMTEYLNDLVADRRRQPREDLVSELIAARDGQDRLDDGELLALLGGLLFAGYDTTRNQLAVAMTVFAEHPTEWARLADQPELAPQAVEEVMRVAGVVSVVPRLATEAFEIAGWEIPAGSLVSLSLAGANHDPTVYEDPYTFDMATARPDGQVGFGGGPHHCLGANLARVEMQEALPLLARRMRDLQVAEAPEWRSPLGGIAGPAEAQTPIHGATIEYRVKAHNPATESENRIHSDEIARRYGFRGGLVPGVTVYGYICHPVLEVLGESWVTTGGARARFLAPCYEGEELDVRVTPEGEVEAWVGDRRCVEGAAWAAPAAASAAAADVPHLERPSDRPDASAEVFAAGTVLESISLDTAPETCDAYLAMIGEPSPLYVERGWVHPGMLLQAANWVLTANVVMPAWVHVETSVHHLRAVLVGEPIEVRARIAGAFERKGHEFVSLDVAWMAADEIVASAGHTAIWQLAG